MWHVQPLAREALLGWRQARSRSPAPQAVSTLQLTRAGNRKVCEPRLLITGLPHGTLQTAPAVCPGPGRILNCQTGLDRVPWAVPGVALVFHCLNIE